MKNFRLILMLLCAALLTGCGSPQKSARTYPDRQRFEIIGIDISAHNGDIDFRKVAAEGIEFVIIKATEGGTFKDKKFIDNIRLARQAGLKVGAYHFFRFDTPGYMQGLNFLNSVRGRDLDLPLIIDLEEWANPNSQPTPKVLERLSEMLDHLENHGHRVMIYTNKNGYARFVKDRLEGYPLWICSLVDEPENMQWDLWQGTHNGWINGINAPVDINAFRGSRAEWDIFASGSLKDAQ